jgi:hypothetical protein
MSIVYAYEVIEFLEGYCLDTLEATSSETVTADASTNEIVVGGGIPYATGDIVLVTGLDIPAPLVATVYYYAIFVSSTRIKLASSFANALIGTAIDFTDVGTGTITLSRYAYVALTTEWIQNRLDRFVVPFVEQVTRQSFSGREQITEYYSGNGKNYLLLNRKPIVSLDEIRYVLGGSNFTILNLQNIEVILAEGLLKAKRNYEEAYYLPVFAKGDYNLKVTYTYGYTSCPDSVKEAIIYLASEQLLGFIGARTGGGSISAQAYSRNFGPRGKYQDIRNDLSRQAYSLLHPYMTGVVG